MPQPVICPANTTIYVYAMSNAANQQQVTITPPAGNPSGTTPAVFTGVGEGNAPMSLTTPGFLGNSGSGWPRFTTGSSAETLSVQIVANPSSNPVVENLDSAGAVGPWPSGASANITMVVGEDGADQDYNDAVVFFMWYTPATDSARAKR